jgi:DNA-binding CsgD family transcriptional regulator
MITSRTNIALRHLLRVVVRARDATRQSAIGNVIVAAGHQLVEDAAGADILLVDDGAEMSDGEAGRTVAIGRVTGRPAALLPHNASAAQIDAALFAVSAGLTVRPAHADTEGFGPEPDVKPETLLTPRELEILTAISEGLGNKAIAGRLDISLHTVKFHIESIFRKLGARNRAEAVAKGRDRNRSAIEL